MSMTLEELDHADALWPDLGPSPWDSSLHPPWPHELGPGNASAEYDRRVSVRRSARARLLALRGQARYTAHGWEVEHLVFVGDASAGIGGCWLCHRKPTSWEASWTRDLTGFESLDDAAREVLAFVALQIERDHHLGEYSRAPWRALPPPRDAHLRHLREFSAQKTRDRGRHPARRT